jgi:hypothetical protein
MALVLSMSTEFEYTEINQSSNFPITSRKEEKDERFSIYDGKIIYVADFMDK